MHANPRTFTVVPVHRYMSPAAEEVEECAAHSLARDVFQHVDQSLAKETVRWRSAAVPLIVSPAQKRREYGDSGASRGLHGGAVYLFDR